MEKKQKLIKKLLFILQIINITIITVIFAKYAFDKSVEINYLFLIIIFVINLLELIYLKINLKKENSKRKLISLILIFIIQIIVVFRIPVYTCHWHNVRDGMPKEKLVFNGKTMYIPLPTPTVMPTIKNVYGL